MIRSLNARAGIRALVFASIAAAFCMAPALAQTLKFGLAMPLTGSQSSFGKDQIKAAEWAVADINAKGGVNGKKLEMIVLDTQGDATLGINAVNRLVNVDRVPVFVTAWSAVVKAVAPIANRERVLGLSIGACGAAAKRGIFSPKSRQAQMAARSSANQLNRKYCA